MHRRWLVVPLAAALVGCPSESADPSDGTPEQNIALLPGLDLLVDFPSLDVGARAVGDPSMLRVRAQDGADDADDTVEPSLSIIATFEVRGPDDEDEAVSHWVQPTSGSANAQAHLWIEDEGDGLIDYLVMREIAGDATLSAWGEVQDLGDGDSEGTLSVRDEPIPLPPISSLPLGGLEDPTAPVEAELTFSSNAGTTNVTAWWDPDESQWSIDGARYMEASTDADGGAIDLIEGIDIIGDEAPELLAIHLQWAADGSGRADAFVCAAPCADVDADRVGTFSECFDAEGVVTWVQRTWVPSEDGDPASCGFLEESPSQSSVDALVSGQ